LRSREPTDEIDNSIGNTECARCLNGSSNVLDLGSQTSHGASAASTSLNLANLKSVGLLLLLSSLALQSLKVLSGKSSEGRANVLSDELLGGVVLSILGNLNLEFALSESKVEELLNLNLGLSDHVTSGDSEVDTSLSDETRDIGGGKEDKRHGEVQAERNVETRVTVELDVRPLEQVETLLVKTTL
jgi:hypothetical protein